MGTTPEPSVNSSATALNQPVPAVKHAPSTVQNSPRPNNTHSQQQPQPQSHFPSSAHNPQTYNHSTSTSPRATGNDPSISNPQQQAAQMYPFPKQPPSDLSVYYVASINYPLVMAVLSDEQAAALLNQVEVALGSTPFQWARLDRPKRMLIILLYNTYIIIIKRMLYIFYIL